MAAANRVSPAFTDAFASSISASYDNGPGDWNPMSWSSSAVVRPSLFGDGCTIARNTGNFGRAQWAQITALAIAAGFNAVGCGVLHSGGTTEACYYGEVICESTWHKYGIQEVDNAYGFTALATSGSGSAISSGMVLTLEVDHTGQLTLYTDEGGGETQRLQVTDTTLTSGRPMATMYVDASTTDAGISAFSGGNLWYEFGDWLVTAGAYVSGTASITPLVPAGHQADDYLAAVLHSAGGETIALTTANGFSQLTNSPSATGATTSGTKVAVYGQVATGSSHSGPVVTDPGDHAGGVVLAIRHPDGAPAVNITAANQKASASTSFSISGATTTVNGCLCLPISARDTDSAAAAYSAVTNADLANLAEFFDFGTTSGNGGGLGIFGGVDTTAGSVGATTGTVASSINANFFLALEPFTSGGGGTNRRRRFLMAA